MHNLRNTAIGFFVLLFFAPSNGWGQDNLFPDFEKKKAKVLNELKNFPKPDTARARILVKLMHGASFLKQMKQIRPYSDELLAISRKTNYTKGLAEYYRFMGSFYKSSLDPAVSQLYFDSAILITRNSKDSALMEVKAQAQRWKGMIYFDQENYYEALNYLFESLKYYEADIGNFTSYLYHTITLIYIRLNNFEQASFYEKKHIEVIDKLGFGKIAHAEAYLTLVDISIQRGEYHLGLFYLDKIKSFMPDEQETMLDFAYYECRGNISYQLQQYDSAFAYYQLAYKYSEASSHTVNSNTALYFLTTIALKLGKTAAAKKYAEDNLALAEKIDSKGGRIKALLNLSDYYHQTGNNNKAYIFLDKATCLKDSLLSETNIKQTTTLAAVYETDKKQKEILKLQNEKQAQDASVKQKSTLNFVFVATIIGLLVFGYLAYRNVKSEQKIANQQQEIHKQKISELEKDRQLLTVDAMLKGQEEERGRIAKDLHDGLGGMLSGVKLSFINMKENMILPAENLIGFEKSIEMLDNTIKELRKVAHNLMPETLARFGLEESLKDFCNAIQTSSGIKVVYQQFGENRKLPTQAQITIYRIVQELVNNVLKHADAKRIIVQLTKSHIKTGVTVEDNGKGFDVKILDLNKGAGFRNIKDRVNYLKGEIDINSQPGDGTSVNIELKT